MKNAWVKTWKKPAVNAPTYAAQARLPDGYDVPGNDGLVVIATRVAVTKVCQEVIAFEGNVDEFAKLRQMALDQGLATIDTGSLDGWLALFDAFDNLSMR